MGYCNWNLASASALPFTYGCDNLNLFPCILFKCVMHVTNDQFSDKFNNTEKNQNGRFIYWPFGRDNFKSFLLILFKFVMLVTNKQFSNKLKNGWKKVQNGRCSAIWPWGRDNMKKCSCIVPKFVMLVTNDQFSDKFNNGWKKIKMAYLLRFNAFYVNNLTLWAR